MSQEGTGCLVTDQGGSDKRLHNFKSMVGGPDPQFPHWIRACNCSQRVWKENGISSFINLFFSGFAFYEHIYRTNNV